MERYDKAAGRKRLKNSRPFSEMIADFCDIRLMGVLPETDVFLFRSYAVGLVAGQNVAPKAGGEWDWNTIARRSGVEQCLNVPVQRLLAPGLEAITRWLQTEKSRSTRARTRPKPFRAKQKPSMAVDGSKDVKKSKAGRKPRQVDELPSPLWPIDVDPPLFADALQMQMLRHGDTTWHLRQAVSRPGENFNYKTIHTWIRGTRFPRSVESLAVLSRIEQRYRLAPGYFRSKFPHPSRSATGFNVNPDIGRAEKRRLAWHLPDDFNLLPFAKRQEIVEWVRRVVLSGTTDFRRYQSAMGSQRYAITFETYAKTKGKRPALDDVDLSPNGELLGDPEAVSATVRAPALLKREMDDLVRFKTSTLTAVGFRRNGVWADETASQRVEHLGLLFGALVATPTCDVHGFGLPLDRLTFGLLVFPGIWDWYMQWRERRRGFYTRWEVDMLSMALSLVRRETGWLRQHPELLRNVQPIDGLITQAEIEAANLDWHKFCDDFHVHAMSRQKEIDRVARVHRDPFEAIVPILEAASPLAEYRKITEEVLLRMPDEAMFPLAAAEALRSFLMLRLGLHLGLRQKNLRELLVCPRGKVPMTERRLEDIKRGELRWSEREGGWEVLIPSTAFKNSHSSFFANKPFRLVLPDLLGLYSYIDAYLSRHRGVLLGDSADPGTFFVKTVKGSSRSAAYDINSFYDAWRLTIQRYGIYNPYTGRGAIVGLLPHGPHNVRDVLATHILKQTGSYEQASYAIQDTPDVVAKHYGRFLPQDKAALAARILNQAWQGE